MGDVFDVVIVGGGIAGSSLAYALATQGRTVTVLESSLEYEDRVRGESLLPWGVKEARNLGVEQILLDAGAHVAPAWMQYFDGVDEPAMIPMSIMVEGIPGSLNTRHPDACQALIDAAAAAGATVVRGVHDVQMSAGQTARSPSQRPTAPVRRTLGWLSGPTGARQRFAVRPVSPSSATSRSTTSPGCW